MVVLLLALAGSAKGSFIKSLSPTNWARPTSAGQANTDSTTYQTWTGFTSPAGPNAATAVFNPKGTPNVVDAAAPGDGAFNIGTDIYSFSASINPVVTIPVYGTAGHLEDVLVQAQSYGADINTADLLVTYTDLSGSHTVGANTLDGYSYNQLYTSTADVGFGLADTVDHAWTFVVPDTTSLTIDFGWDAVSSALQALSVDTHSAAVPEPISMGLMLLGGSVLLGRARPSARFGK